jgi:hypothetical protein
MVASQVESNKTATDETAATAVTAATPNAIPALHGMQYVGNTIHSYVANTLVCSQYTLSHVLNETRRRGTQSGHNHYATLNPKP